MKLPDIPGDLSGKDDDDLGRYYDGLPYKVAFWDSSPIVTKCDGECTEKPNDPSKPIVEDRTWLALPPWIRTEDCHIACDDDGLWKAYVSKPLLTFALWFNTSKWWVAIHPDYAPKLDGKWEGSLVKIPPQFVHRDGMDVTNGGWHRFDTFDEFCEWAKDAGYIYVKHLRLSIGRFVRSKSGFRGSRRIYQGWVSSNGHHYAWSNNAYYRGDKNP